MAAGPIDLNSKFATVECDSSVNVMTIKGVGASVVNAGDNTVFVSMNNSGSLFRDGLQHDGEIEMEPGDSLPLPAEASKLEHQCLPAETTKLWYVPAAG